MQRFIIERDIPGASEPHVHVLRSGRVVVL